MVRQQDFIAGAKRHRGGNHIHARRRILDKH
jgi:hypothetical protein